jgi:hypothetical protein
VILNHKPNAKHDHVFAIVRIDTFHDASVPPEVAVTVKNVVWTQEDAEREVARLNRLNASKGSVYFSKMTRLERRSF